MDVSNEPHQAGDAEKSSRGPVAEEFRDSLSDHVIYRLAHDTFAFYLLAELARELGVRAHQGGGLLMREAGARCRSLTYWEVPR